MQRNILNLPHHIRRLRRVHSEIVALAMAGEYGLNWLADVDRRQEHDLWHAASHYHNCILEALRAGELEYVTRWSGFSDETTGAVFKSEIIWPWALAELSDNSLWYGAGDFIDTTQSTAVITDTGQSVSRGRDNQSLVIAGLSRLLVSRTHGAYRYGQKPNISALARDAVNVLADVLPADKDKTETFRKVISESLGALPAADTYPE